MIGLIETRRSCQGTATGAKRDLPQPLRRPCCIAPSPRCEERAGAEPCSHGCKARPRKHSAYREDVMHIARTTAALLALAAPLALAGLAAAQTIDDVAKAMGTAKAETLHYSGTGSVWNVGQSYQAGERWPRFNAVRGTRSF